MRRAILLVGVVLFVFGVVLPRLVDYNAVRAALAALTPGQLALLGATSVIGYVASAGPSRVLVPGLSWPHAIGSDLAARAVASTVPGPTDVATRLVLYRQWSISTTVASAGIVLAALFESFSCFALPLIATAGLLLTGHPIQSRALLLALIGLIVLVGAAVLLVSIVRSESLARRLGGWLDRMAKRIWKVFRKTPPTGIVEGMLDLRERSKAILTGHGLLGFAAAVVAKLTWFVVLEVALWCVGSAWMSSRRRPCWRRWRSSGSYRWFPLRRGCRSHRGRLHRHPVERRRVGADGATHCSSDAVPHCAVVRPDPDRVGPPARDAAGPLGRAARAPGHVSVAVLDLREPGRRPDRTTAAHPVVRDPLVEIAVA